MGQVRDNINWMQAREKDKKERMMAEFLAGLQALVAAGASAADIAAYRKHINRKVNEWFEGCRGRASECREHVRKLARTLLAAIIPDRRKLEHRVNRIAQKAYDDFMREMTELRQLNLSNAGISARDDVINAMSDPGTTSTGSTFILELTHPLSEDFRFLQFCWYEVYCVDQAGNRTHPPAPGSYNAPLMFNGTACLPGQVRATNPATGEDGVLRQPGQGGECVDTLMPNSPFYGAPATSNLAGTVVRVEGRVIVQDTPSIHREEARALDAYVRGRCGGCPGWAIHWHVTTYIVDKNGKVLASVSWEKVIVYGHAGAGRYEPIEQRIQNVVQSPVGGLSGPHSTILTNTCTANGWVNPIVP
jgi:hypothetical protein